MNVNLSVVQLLSEDIVEIIRKALRDSGLKPRNLMLEVTEGLAINDMERMKEILVRIKKLGVKIALDDFGIAYVSHLVCQKDFEKLLDEDKNNGRSNLYE